MRHIVWALLLALQTGEGSEPQPQKPGPPVVPALVAYQIGAPMYPEAAQKARLRGTVLLTAVVTAGGITRDIVVSQPLNPLLERTCEAAVDHTRFEPRPGGGDVAVSFTFTFVLTAESAKEAFAVCEPCPFMWRVVGSRPPDSSIH